MTLSLVLIFSAGLFFRGAMKAGGIELGFQPAGVVVTEMDFSLANTAPADAMRRMQLVTDRASGVGAMIERTRRQGIVRGAGRDGLTLEYVPLQADVQVGDRVLSSGTDGLYPRGVPIGTVLEVSPGGELFHSIHLAPAVDFGQLDSVFVLLADSLPGRLKGSTSASP